MIDNRDFIRAAIALNERAAQTQKECAELCLAPEGQTYHRNAAAMFYILADKYRAKLTIEDETQ